MEMYFTNILNLLRFYVRHSIFINVGNVIVKVVNDLSYLFYRGLGSYFGSQVMTKHGILFNNHLANLPSHSHPEKDEYSRARPLTLYTPIILMDNKQVRCYFTATPREFELCLLCNYRI